MALAGDVVAVHLGRERALELRHRAAEGEARATARGADDLEALLLQPLRHAGDVGGARAEAVGVLLGGEPPVVAGRAGALQGQQQRVALGPGARRRERERHALQTRSRIQPPQVGGSADRGLEAAPDRGHAGGVGRARVALFAPCEGQDRQHDPRDSHERTRVNPTTRARQATGSPICCEIGRNETMFPACAARAAGLRRRGSCSRGPARSSPCPARRHRGPRDARRPGRRSAAREARPVRPGGAHRGRHVLARRREAGAHQDHRGSAVDGPDLRPAGLGRQPCAARASRAGRDRPRQAGARLLRPDARPVGPAGPLQALRHRRRAPARGRLLPRGPDGRRVQGLRRGAPRAEGRARGPDDRGRPRRRQADDDAVLAGVRRVAQAGGGAARRGRVAHAEQVAQDVPHVAGGGVRERRVPPERQGLDGPRRARRADHRPVRDVHRRPDGPEGGRSRRS